MLQLDSKETSNIISIIIAIITLFGILVTMFLTLHQIRLSNKHQLFDRRLDKYIIVKDLLDTYKRVNDIFTEKLNLEAFNRFILRSLMENDVLKDIQWTVDNPTKKESFETIHKKFRWIGKTAEELFFLFDKDKVNYFSDFIKKYRELIMWLQRYNINAEKTKGTGFGKDDREKARTEVLKVSNEMNLLLKKIEKKKIVESLAKQIKLK